MSSIIQLFAPRQSDARAMRNHCSMCRLKEQCLPAGLNAADLRQVEGIIGHHYRVQQGGYLFRMNDPLIDLYAVRLGGFKTVQFDNNGTEHIVGFQMTGELLGMDAINNANHRCDSVALEDSEVCAIPFKQLEELFEKMPLLLRNFQRLMSQEITNNQNRMLLGGMRAEQRMAAFLVSLGARYQARGYSATRFQLRMSRKDIGNYLGLTIESISRLISIFRKKNLLHVTQRTLEIIDPVVLQQIASGSNQEKLPSVLTVAGRARINFGSTATHCT